MGLAEFNAAPAADLTASLLACCDVPNWATVVRDGRPYGDVASLIDRADRAALMFCETDVDRALAAHPRIGERVHGASTEARWSRREQAGVDGDEDTQAALLDGNRAYEVRFGRVFLICATGLSGAEILAAQTDRLGNDDDTEATVVADELRKIALLRLRRLVSA